MKTLVLLTACLGLFACNEKPAGKATIKIEDAPVKAAKAKTTSTEAKPAKAAVTLDSVLAAKDRILIDVRTPGEFATAHIPGSVNVPVANLGGLAAKIPSKDTPVVVFCLSGGRSSRALGYLKSKGYTQVVNGGGYQKLAGKMGVALAR